MSDKTSPRYDRETEMTEMERIAREAREFREGEATRIAAEKEDARLAAMRQKELERQRISQQSGQFLQDAAKEREVMSRLKDLTAQQQRMKDRFVDSDVSTKAKRLLEKEQLERQRMEDERLLLQERSLKKSSSRDSASDSAILASFSSELGHGGEEEASETARGASALSKQSTAYYDTAMSQSSLDDRALDKSPMKQETVYYDATSTPGPVDGSKTPARSTVKFQDAGEKSEEIHDGNFPPGTVYKTPRQTPKPQDSVKKTVYFDARGNASDNATSPAGVQARALFSARNDGDSYLIDPSEGEREIDHHEQESIIAHRSQTIPRKSKKEPADDEHILIHDRVQEACYEIPISYDSSTGNFTVSRDAELSMTTSMAPSRVDGRWSGTLEGKTSLGPSAEVNSSVGSATLDYKANTWSKLSLGMIRGHELYHPLITIGGTLIQRGSMLGVTFYHNASFLHAMLLEHSMYSLSFRHLFPKTRWILSTELSRRQELSFGLSNAKLSSRLSCSLRNPRRVSAKFDLRPKISEDRAAHLAAEWHSMGIWHVGVSLVQSLHSKLATVGLGVRLYSTRGLEWILSWNRGDATVRIPIVVAGGLRNVHPFQVLYFSMISFLIQEGISELWGWKHPTAPEADEGTTSPTAASTAKARQDAELQKVLMERQAKRKKREEIEKEGLVIYKAKYFVKGGDEWDATTPLQFWVNRSSLTLPPKSKSQLLGFYDISTESNKKSSPVGGATSFGIGSSLWWKAIWDDLVDLPVATSMEATNPSGLTPALQIRYDFHGQPYTITIRDEEELILPNPNATRL